MSDCLFCKIIAGDIPSTKVFEDEHTFAFEDIHPGAPCHVLVVPKRHISTANDITPGDHALVGKMYQTASKVAADKGVVESGYRLVMNAGEGAGQSVFHIHLHVLGGREFSWPPG